MGKMGTIKVKYLVQMGGTLLVAVLLPCIAWSFAPQKTTTKSEPLHPEVDSVWVAKPDGAQSCEPQTGLSLSQGAEGLKSLKIPILDSKKAADGKMHAQMCGASKGTENAYLIPRRNLAEATQVGYREVTSVNLPEKK
jgi:hypothetical protein